MYIPFITQRSPSSKETNTINKRGIIRKINNPIIINGKQKFASAFGRGSSIIDTIIQGLFKGRDIGGLLRDEIFGSRTFGSGFGHAFGSARGVAGRSFPFYFWPITWSEEVLAAVTTYLNVASEYGDVTNTSRPGGALATTKFTSLTNSNSTFRLLADNETVTSLIFDITQSCSPKFNTNPTPSSTPLDPQASVPRPEQVVQYYRASSIALSLDGYKNNATYGAEGSPDSPLPANVDVALLGCLNDTIGAAAPLIDGGMVVGVPLNVSLVGLVSMFWVLVMFV